MKESLEHFNILIIKVSAKSFCLIKSWEETLNQEYLIIGCIEYSTIQPHWMGHSTLI